MFKNLNNGSICQIIKVQKVMVYYNQYQNQETQIKAGLHITDMECNVRSTWDGVNDGFSNDWDTVIIAYARPLWVQHKENEWEQYTKTHYSITRVVDIDQDIYLDRLVRDAEWMHDQPPEGIFKNTNYEVYDDLVDLDEIDIDEVDI